MKKFSIGIDIGGTKVRCILFDGASILKSHEVLYSDKPPQKYEFFSTLWGAVDRIVSSVPQKQLLGIGIGTAGNVAKDRIYAGPTLDILNHVDLRGEVEKRYGLAVKVVNDVQSGIIGEWLLGAGRGAQSVFMLIVSTGASGAFIKDGVLQHGSFGSGYAAGFIIVDAERSRRGERGDLEYFTSEQFFTRRGIDPKVANTEAQKGNREMQMLWKEFGEYLGTAVASVINLFEPEVVVIGGGGLSNAWPLFENSTKETARRLIVHPVACKEVRIIPAKL